MATRRPNVPRVTSPARAPEAEKDAGQGADVIRADFGGGARGAAGKGGTGSTHAGTSGSASAAAGGSKPGEGTSGAAKSATAKSGTATSGAGKSAAGKSGTAKSSTGKSNTGKSSTAKKKDAPDAGAEAAEDLDPVPAKAFSGRMLALAVVMIAITVMLAPTVKIYIDKRAEIAALNADIASKQAEQDQLNQQISRWQDPNYVKQQARDRINMVMPGETSYWVFGSDLPAEALPEAVPGAAAGSPVDVPWVDALWESVKRAGTD
ncbi:septum formation initiator family protein [Pseudarthrobacter sp. J64]|uniref:FtsB family cell division protein n=1 Tax=Pseudarthrobacter sp. J64 TaxID=3116485 RepID=UPI002E819560|nr:septum formation initiator family protein [Pseudarthrobacter sp. J64]MEE2570856.1 septum formation initiator family protein [Pseudarthrobacter sp. J64]